MHAGKQFQQLHAEDEHNNKKVRAKTVRSVLLKKLIFTVSSSSVVGNAVKLLSTLNKEAAERGDLANLIVIHNDQFQGVCTLHEILLFFLFVFHVEVFIFYLVNSP